MPLLDHIYKARHRYNVTFPFPLNAYVGTMLKILIIIVALLPTVSQAQESYGTVNFLTGWQLPDGSYQTGIDFEMNEGWKTYWRAPGPGGIPPSFNWNGSTNITNIEILWPTPEVFENYGLYSIGYKDHVTLPVRITPLDAAQPVRVNLQLNFGVCSDICVPASVQFSTNLGKLPDSGISTIKSALATTAIGARNGGVQTASCDITPNGTGFNIQANLKFTSQPGMRTTVIEYPDPDIWIDIAKTRVNGQHLTANAAIKYYGKGMLSIERSNIRITVLEGTRAIEINGCPAS